MIGRREFVKGTVVTGAGLAIGSAACSPGGPADASTSGAGGENLPPFELDEMSLQEFQARMTTGQESARSITEKYLRRIEEVDRSGPELRSIIELNPDALEIADQLDSERRARGPRGPLHGIPVVLKDNIDTHDGMTTTAGSLAMEGSVPTRDSFIAARLREAGAVLLAKANLSEWANFRGLRSVSGWSGRGGQCRNPYSLDRSPCGSSSGSAVAVAANLAAVALGTETNGSIMCPAALTGIVGIKPTVGLWSRSGIIPISHTQDTAGPMARTVADAAMLLGALTGVDEADSATVASEEHRHSDYTQFLEPGGLQGARIGVARNFAGFTKGALALLDEAARAMRDGGAVVIDPTDVPQLADEDWGAQDLVLEYEFKHGITQYLESLGAGAAMGSLADLIAFNEANAERELALFGQEVFVSAAERGPLTDRAYVEALASIRRLTRQDGIDAVMSQHALAAIIAPTMGPAWLIDQVLGDRFDSGYSAGQAAIAGYPSITVPMGYVSGLPVGVSFFGGAWSEPVLIRLAYAYEQATRHRIAPSFQSSVA